MLKRFDQDLTIILTTVQEILCFAYLERAPTSDLSSIIHHDICIILKNLLWIKLVQTRIDGIWANCRASGQELKPKPGCLDNIREEVNIISRDNFRLFSILDCLAHT